MPDPEAAFEKDTQGPGHRPGMHQVVNRGMDARDASGNRLSAERPKVGPADPQTAKAALDAALHTDPAPPPPKTAPAPSPSAPDPSGVGGRTREDTIMDQVSKAGG